MLLKCTATFHCVVCAGYKWKCHAPINNSKNSKLHPTGILDLEIPSDTGETLLVYVLYPTILCET